MALLKSLNDSCRKDVELQLQTYQLRLTEVREHKALLKQKAKAELTRPGTLAAAFTLGVLVVPGSKGKRRADAERAESNDKRTTAEGQSAQPEQAEPSHAEAAGKEKKSKPIDPLDIFFSVISSVVVRLATNWVTGLAATSKESMQDADVDASTQVEL